jgi:putative two-component system response regulator
MITAEQIRTAKILIIDDEPANVMVLEETLKQSGQTSIQSITDPRQALETYKIFQPDLVLLDLNMPHLNGFEVLAQIKEADPENNVPIMILTAQIDQGTRLQALDSGVRDFLTKPFDILEVSLRIRTMLEMRLLYRQAQDAKNSLEESNKMAAFELTATKLKLQSEIKRRKKLEEQLKKFSTNTESSDD